MTNRRADVRIGLGNAPSWPVSGVRVRATGMGISVESTSEPDGSFGFFHVLPGEYRIGAGDTVGFEALPGLAVRVAEGGCFEVHLVRRRMVNLRVRAPYSEGILMLEPEGVDPNRPEPGLRDADPELAAYISGGIATFAVPPWRYRLALKGFGQAGKLYHAQAIEIREGTEAELEFRASQ